MLTMDVNNNNSSCRIDSITKDTVEAELEKLKLIEDDYESDDNEIRGRVSRTGTQLCQLVS
jgi:hypothetical protein